MIADNRACQRDQSALIFQMQRRLAPLSLRVFMTDDGLPDHLRKLEDHQWFDMLVKSIDGPDIDGVRFPGFPAPDMQTSFVGSANEAALREAFNFYVLAKGYAAALGMPIGNGRRFLDFGMGWGRFLRFFWKDMTAENLYGCDIDPDIIKIARNLGVPGNLDRIYHFGRLPYPDDFLHGGIAYSVFTHLPENVHLHWRRELVRVMRPGAVFSMTIEPRRFIDFIENLPETSTSPWHRSLRTHAALARKYREGYDRGEFIYIPTGGGDFRNADVYGDAVVPVSYIEQHWAPEFALRAYIDDANAFPQAVAVLQRV
jgi:hypothetical protein